MKKFIAAVVSALAALALCICLAACADTGIEGTYKFSSMKVAQGSTTIEISVGEKYMGMIQLDEDSFVLTMNGDNTFEMKTTVGMNTTQKGTWEEKDGKYYLSAEDEPDKLEAVLEGKTITLSMEGTTVILKKSK